MDQMSIGDFARDCELSVKALRLYDEMDLLPPARVDPFSGYRYYAEDQLPQARLVAALRRIGMPLARIRELVVLPGDAAADELRSYWRQVEADVRSRRGQVTALVAALRAKETAMDDTTQPVRTRMASRVGQGARDRQLDAVLTRDDWWVVADGFGESAVPVLDGLAASGTPRTAADWERALNDAALGLGATEPESGATVTGLSVSGSRALLAHIGDSRAYRVRDGEPTRLTRDHTDVAGLLEDGRLTEEEARLHPRRALLNRALVRGSAVEPDLQSVRLRAGDRLVLMTDGVHAMLPAGRLTELIGSGDPESAVDLVQEAVEAAGAEDNYAVVVVDVLEIGSD